MTYRKKRILQILIIFFSIMLIGLFLLFSQKSVDFEVYIFSDLSEFEKLDEYKEPDAKLIRSETSSLAREQYKAFYEAEYTSKNIRFKIFAYEFNSSLDAKKYYSMITKKNTVLDTDYLKKDNMIGNISLAVIDNSNMYYIEMIEGEYSQLMELLKKVFSISVTEKIIGKRQGDG